MPKATITVTNNAVTTMRQWRTVVLTFNHAALVSAGRSRADGRDLRVRWTGTSLPPAWLVPHVVDPNTATTKVYFCLKAAINASANTNLYELHFGNLAASDQAPVAIRDKSQWHPALGGGFAGNAYIQKDAMRNQPFLFYEDWKHKFDGTDYYQAGTDDSLEGLLWDDPYAAGWTMIGYNEGGGVKVPAGTGSILVLRSQHLSVSDPPNATRRIRARLRMPSSVTNPRTGIISAMGIDHLEFLEYTFTFHGLRQSYVNNQHGDVVAGVYTEVGSNTNADVTGIDVWLDAMLNDQDLGNHALTSKIHTSPFFGPDNSSGSYNPLRNGLYEDSGSSGDDDVKYLEWWWELWDGIPDSQYTVGLGSIPAPTLPEVQPGIEMRRYALVDRTSYPEYLVIHRGQFGPHHLNRWLVVIDNMAPDESYDVRALVLANKGGAGIFSWAPPHESARMVRIVPGSYRPMKSSFAGYSVRLDLEEVIL